MTDRPDTPAAPLLRMLDEADSHLDTVEDLLLKLERERGPQPPSSYAAMKRIRNESRRLVRLLGGVVVGAKPAGG